MVDEPDASLKWLQDLPEKNDSFSYHEGLSSWWGSLVEKIGEEEKEGVHY
jgi:hypothetical protein